MTDQFNATIQTLMDRVEQKTRELAEMKRLINALCREAGRESVYDSADGPVDTGGLRADQFYGKTPIVAAREFLELRGRAVTLEEILEGLTRGGFDFAAQNWTPELRLRNLGISVGKNTSIFHKLPNGYIGLVKFYPDIEAEKKQKKTPAAANGLAAKDGTGETVDEEKTKATNA